MKINIEQIKTGITDLPAKIKQIFKIIIDQPHSGKYLMLSLALLILFLIMTFPYDFLIKKKIYGLEGNVVRSVDMSEFEFSIFGETYFDNLSLVMNNSTEINCKHSILNITLNPITLFIRNKIKSDFQFDSLKYISKDFESMFNVSGNLDLILDKQSNIPKDGTIKVILNDSMIKLNNLSIPGPMGPLVLKIETVNIQSGNIDAVITNGVLRFNAFKLTGSDISCDVNGTIEISGITNNSKIDLTINVDSESSVLDQYKDILTSFIKNNKITLRIKGTVAKPELTLITPGKNEN